MEILLSIICVCLFVFSILIFLKYISLKRNIQYFSKELEKLKNSDYRQPLKVTDFDRDLTGLAVKINEHTDIQRKLRNEYDQSQKQLNTIISGISHDFRTPLTASLGYLQLIEKSEKLSEKNTEYLGIAIQKNKYLKELSDEFFELTKIESSKEIFNFQEINLSNILTEIILEQHHWITERNISASFDIPDGVLIQADLHCLTRILNNLMSNAQKYTSDCFCITLKQDGEQVILHVKNTLADSNSVNIERVFEPFYRMDARTESGSGLGLYIVKLLCDKLYWKVSASIINHNFLIEIII